MWHGHINALKHYHNLAIDEWVKRGYRNNMHKMKISGKIAYPRWFGRDEFHGAHRFNMLRKDSCYYSQYAAGRNRRTCRISGNEMSMTVSGLTLFIAYTQYGFDGFAISGIFHRPIDILEIIKLQKTIKRKFARLV